MESYIVNVDDKKYGLRLISYDEEEDVKSEYVVLLADISHLYWEADANGIIVPRRVAAEDYSHDHVNFFFDNTPDMILSQHGFVQVHEKMFVPARNIVSIHAVKGGSEIDMGDLHPVFTRRDTQGLLREWRRELLRSCEPSLVAKVDRLIEKQSGGPDFPGP